MPDPRRFELEELVNRPGTYFNPQTEVLMVVDDSPELDSEIFNMEEFEGADWVLISEEVAVDEDRRDELLQAFQARHGAEDFEADPDAEPEEYEEEEEELGRG
jgi:cupin superfamily acireductone dioxygenase involved in methionine salvage